MSKSKKVLFICLVMLVILVVASPFLYRSYKRASIAREVDKIDSCLSSGGCMNPETMTCGPYTPNDPNVMCDQKKSTN